MSVRGNRPIAGPYHQYDKLLSVSFAQRFKTWLQIKKPLIFKAIDNLSGTKSFLIFYSQISLETSPLSEACQHIWDVQKRMNSLEKSQANIPRSRAQKYDTPRCSSLSNGSHRIKSDASPKSNRSQALRKWPRQQRYFFSDNSSFRKSPSLIRQLPVLCRFRGVCSLCFHHNLFT